MDYDRWAQSQRNAQQARIEAVRQKIAARQSIVGPGKVVPDTGDLPIGTGRRMPLAVLFLDISDFSGRPNFTVEEQASNLRVLTFFFAEMLRIVGEYGGTVEKNTGDGLMAYFSDGEGTPPADACKRSVACALTMFAAHTNFLAPAIAGMPNTPPIKFRISIDYGEVTIAEVGIARGFKGILAIGQAANVAAKMLSIAGPDELVLGENAARRIPLDWLQAWVEVKTADTGFIHTESKKPYHAFLYKGRWIGQFGVA